MIGNPVKTPFNSYLPLLAEGMVNLIDAWRAEVSEEKAYKSAPTTSELEEYLRKAESLGVRATLVALTVLACEWVFRVRQATEADIEKVLYEMKSGLCKSVEATPVLTPFQAHLLIKSVEPNLREQMENVRIPVAFGFEADDPHLQRAFFLPDGPPQPKRVAPRRLVQKKAGPIPTLAPIIAGVIVETFFEEAQPRGSQTRGRELCALLLGREEVQWREFKKWQTLVSELSREETSLRSWFRDRMRQAHDQIFEMPGVSMSPEAFLERCEADPRSVLWWLAQEDILESVYSYRAKWG